jgi:DNA-binding NarL/FixJ family response regulator
VLTEQATQTTVLVAVQSPEVREALVAMLGALDGFRVVAETGSEEQTLEHARRLRPRLALVDEDLAGHGGWWAINALQREQLADVIVALGRRGEGLFAQRAGAQVYVQMGCPPRELVSAVRDALQAA